MEQTEPTKSPRQELAHQYYDIDSRIDELEAQVIELNKEKKEIERKLITQMESEGIKLFKDSDLGKTFYFEEDCYVKNVDEQAFFAWVRETGAEGAIKETIHAGTKKAMIKEFVKETGQDVPGVNVEFYTKIKMRKS